MTPWNRSDIVITADDWGMSPAVNRGILELARRGIVRRVSILVDARFARTDLEALRALPGTEIGLHFNLSFGNRRSSSDRPLWKWMSPWQSRACRARIRDEFRRQVQVLRSWGLDVKHFDGHQHVHVFPGVVPIVAPLARELGMTSTRLPWDPVLWRTNKFLLWAFCQRARGFFLRAKLDYLPSFFYPQPPDFGSRERLRSALESRANCEVIVHPADADDFEATGCDDPYRSGRVNEYRVLHALGDST
jgi:predicted glycoside hydrolase/deacetylase ChbG (UPF0249 family)